jgi:glycosyltransferase involved in cell wall biosynthesis
MRIVIINETFSPKMGYLGTMLPMYLARENLEVHLITTDLPAYHNLPEFKTDMPAFIEAQGIPAGSSSTIDGYVVHVLPHTRLLGHVRALHLYRTLRAISPDIVYSVLTLGWMPLEAALSKLSLGFKLFIGSHTTALSFPLARATSIPLLARLKIIASRWLPGRFVSLLSEKCYCPTGDCAEIASRFFGVQARKTEVVHLGVDCEIFHPIASDEERGSRATIRATLGLCGDEVVCVYSGKMTQDKNALIVARAIELLRREGLPLRGLFIGDGVQRDAIAGTDGCVTLDFMVFSALGAYYRACDVAVWPTNESTSMLDAVACGLPIIVSDRIYQDHVTGNGCSYQMNNLDDLCAKLRMFADPKLRELLGGAGATKMKQRFSWTAAAARRITDFRRALGAQNQ